MNLTFRYDPEADVLDIRTGRMSSGAAPIEGPELGFIAVESVGENDRDLAGVIMIYAASYLAPYFRLRRGNTPPRSGDSAHTRYDRETDTLTWGAVADTPEMVSHAGDLTAYWQTEEDFDEDDPLFEPIGLSLRKASKHLSPWFALVEPAAD